MEQPEQVFRVALKPAALAVVGIMLAASPVRAEIVGHWTFNEGEGTNAFDSTTNGNHGVIHGNATYVELIEGANFGLSLDGANPTTNSPGTGINFGTSTVFEVSGSDGVTVEAWVDINTDVAQGNNEFVFRRIDSQYGIGYKADGGANRATAHQNGEPAGETAPNLFDADGFYHFVYTKSPAAGIDFYINGVNQGFTGGFAAWSDPVGTNDLVAGVGGGNALEAVYDELVLHNVVLSGAEVLERFEAGPTLIPFVKSADVQVADTTAIEFTGDVGVEYELESQSVGATNEWTGTGIFAVGTGATQQLFDPTGFSTGKEYRVSIQL